MVMHARKPQRISDGYFEKHQTHPYQHFAQQKYNTKSERRGGNEYVHANNRYTTLRSPNGNVPGHGHSTHNNQSVYGHHHYNHIPDTRGYAAPRNSYVQKGPDKERDRDYKSSRNKYTDSVRLPNKDHSKESERERSNHERNEADKKNRTSGMNVSVSRSSKYDKRSAPPSANVPSGSEWSEHISSSGKRYYYNSISSLSQWEKPREWDSRRTSSKDSTYSSRNNREKRPNSRLERQESEKSQIRPNSSSERYWNHSSHGEDTHDRPRKKRPGQKIDRKENSYAPTETNSKVRTNSENNIMPPVVVLDNSNQPTVSLLAAALPRIMSLPPVVSTSSNNVASPEPGPSGLCHQGMSHTNVVHPGIGGGADTPRRDQGPPTPTHSENMDPHAPPLHLEQALPRRMEGLGSYSSVVGMAHQPPLMLTPSLVNYVRTDLTGHVTAWPADMLERQANKYNDEAYQLGCLQLTRVSADLKGARSLVRHTEIQATLQEQKIMYLRQQITELEALKSQNCFMSED